MVVFLKVLFMIAMVLLMAAPFVAEYISFCDDKKKNLSFRRFRVLIYTAIYIVAVTIVLSLLNRFFAAVESLSFVRWVADHISESDKIEYFCKVFFAILLNVGVGALYLFLGRFVRIGLKKRLDVPSKTEGVFSFWQKAEQKAIAFFHKETWFFVARIILYVSLLLSALYGLLFLVYQIPAIFSADWIPYDFISSLFEAGYVYPTVTLLGLWEIYFFLSGVERVEKECPELLQAGDLSSGQQCDLNQIDEIIKKKFEDYYICDVDLAGVGASDVFSAQHNEFTKIIVESAENDARNPRKAREIYSDCLDKIIEGNKGILINGTFFSEFSMFFLRYLSAVMARGDNLVFVCNSDEQIDEVYHYVLQGLSEISSLYCKGEQSEERNFDNPVWRIVKVSGEHVSHEEAEIESSSVLITSLSYLCSVRFEEEHGGFITLIDAVVFVDTLNTVNKFNRQLAILNTQLKHIVKNHVHAANNPQGGESTRVRYLSRKIRYICFDDTRIPGLDKILKNALSLDFETVDIMRYGSKALVRCYRFEGKKDENGRTACVQPILTGEESGVAISMAVECILNGASRVSVFASDCIPYAGIEESLHANRGMFSVDINGNNLQINRKQYNPNGYSVIIAFDSDNNLPTAVRRYLSMVSDQPVLINIFSRNYLLRDYYADNVSSLWNVSQIERIPQEIGTKKDIAQKILVKAYAGGITKEEIFRLVNSQAGETLVPLNGNAWRQSDLNAVLRAVLQIYGADKSDELNLFNCFEFSAFHSFDKSGKYCSGEKIVLRRSSSVLESLTGRDMVQMAIGDEEVISLPVPRSRLKQNYIAGQNILHNGTVYTIERIDTSAAQLRVNHAVGGKNNESYSYIQDRTYRVTLDPDYVQQLFPLRHAVLGGAKEQTEIGVTDAYISAFRAPMEVLTEGYFELDSHALAADGQMRYTRICDKGNEELAKQTYRRYGCVADPIYSSESLISATNLNADGVLMLSLRLCGKFGQDADKTMLAAAFMLNELIHSMFPSVADAVAVCPVLKRGLPAEMPDIFRRMPRLAISGRREEEEEEDFELLVIEDCAANLGVVSVLMSMGNDILDVLFSPMFSYLKWYFGSERKSDYLSFASEDELAYFDFEALYQLSEFLGDSKYDILLSDEKAAAEYDVCDFCGKQYLRDGSVVALEDGRQICKDCAKNLVGNDKLRLNRYLDQAKIFLESRYGIVIGDEYKFCFDSTLKIVSLLKRNGITRRGVDMPLISCVTDDKKVYVEYSLPAVNILELLVRELTHVWQLKNLPDLSEELAEGCIALVAVQYLRFMKKDFLANARANYYESSEKISGVGYRKLVKALVDSPKYGNNPFTYLRASCGLQIGEKEFFNKIDIENANLGKPYVPKNPDRFMDGTLPYFYRTHLAEQKMQIAYDAIMKGISERAECVPVDSLSSEEIINVCFAIIYDHPELFWVGPFSASSDTVYLHYTVSEEETATLQKRIDEAVAKYLEGIDDSMSAYDVALRLHLKMISEVDYDSIALEEEKKAGGPEKGKIDYLRTICGVFLNGKAVCEGYARSMQYLLQKCGIESAEIVGDVKKQEETNRGHAWNILKIDGDYYYSDTTWDDASNTVQEVKESSFGFDYFCITTEELLRSRDINKSYADIPDCFAVSANYYAHNDLIIDSYDLSKIVEIAKSAVSAEKMYVSFKCRSKEVFDETIECLFSERSDCAKVMEAVVGANKRILGNVYQYKTVKQMLTITIFFKTKQDTRPRKKNER